jgi:5-methylcytosine-specific restriction endonuclease McrA
MRRKDVILIQDSVSSSGRTRVVHIIFNVMPSLRSWSSYIMMKEVFRSMDEDMIEENEVLYKYLSKRYLFLVRRLKRRGELRCDYCGKNGLIIGHNRKSNNKILNLATIDHIIPVSKGIDRLDEKNWGVACRKCNGKKGSRPVEEFMEEKKNERVKNEKIKSNETKRVKGKMVDPFQGRKEGSDHGTCHKYWRACHNDCRVVHRSALLRLDPVPWDNAFAVVE